jgi:hypothetical protein
MERRKDGKTEDARWGPASCSFRPSVLPSLTTTHEPYPIHPSMLATSSASTNAVIAV